MYTCGVYNTDRLFVHIRPWKRGHSRKKVVLQVNYHLSGATSVLGANGYWRFSSDEATYDFKTKFWNELCEMDLELIVIKQCLRLSRENLPKMTFRARTSFSKLSVCCIPRLFSRKSSEGWRATCASAFSGLFPHMFEWIFHFLWFF